MTELEATIGFIDLAGFSALTEVHGDQQAVTLLERFEAVVARALGGPERLVKTIGDAVMVAFEDPEAAIEDTTRIFDACAAEPGFPLPRAGLHHGATIKRGDDFFGATVNLAARVADQAHGGQVLGTRLVADVARGQGVPVVDLGAFSLRNINAPVELFEIGLCLVSSGVTIDPVCRMQVPRAEAAGRLRHDDADYWFCSLDCAATFAADPASFVTT